MEAAKKTNLQSVWGSFTFVVVLALLIFLAIEIRNLKNNN